VREVNVVGYEMSYDIKGVDFQVIFSYFQLIFSYFQLIFPYYTVTLMTINDGALD